MSKFKVGDRVRSLDTSYDATKFCPYGVIFSIMDDGYQVTLGYEDGTTENLFHCFHEVVPADEGSLARSSHYAPDSTGLTGGRVNYYLARIDHPQREEQPAYTAECEDIISALGMTFDEANIFKEIWRSANARKGNGKPDHKALYGAEKIVHYAGRNLRRIERESE